MQARGNRAAALEHYRRAVALAPQDRENQRYLDRALASGN
jgi:hypothetical protein